MSGGSPKLEKGNPGYVHSFTILISLLPLLFNQCWKPETQVSDPYFFLLKKEKKNLNENIECCCLTMILKKATHLQTTLSIDIRMIE